ncbi:MAG: HD domain-containing protein [Lachnospiraceae bacterium]|nr:HD domain-containing protein [Lachnospiraceae bacterium]
MNRIERVREVVDDMILDIKDNEERRCAYVHLYGVSQACGLLAMKRGENVELAIIAGMLHDISTYATMSSEDHAHKGADMARDILKELNIFSKDEIEAVCTAIYHHSDKELEHGPLDEILKDADVMQHVLYNPLVEVKANEQERFCSLLEEMQIKEK